MVRYTIEKSDNEENHGDTTDPAESLENKETKEPTEEVKELENKDTTDATESSENKGTENEKSKPDDSSKSPGYRGERSESVEQGGSSGLQEEKDSQQKETTLEMKPGGKEDIKMDRMSHFEKLLLDCRNRQIEMESKMVLLEERLGKSMEVIMRKMDSVLGYQQRSGPPPPAPSIAWSKWPIPTLLQAAQRGDTEALLRLLSGERRSWEVLLQQRDAHGDTALHLAATHGHARIVQLLLMVGASASTPGRRLRTPLHCAAANGHLEIVRRLLNAGVTVDAKDSDGATALAAAAMCGRFQAVSILLKNGARPDVVDEKGLSPIFLASSGGHANVVRLLLENGVSMDAEGRSLLEHAAKADQWSVVKLLMDKGVSPEHSSKVEDSLLALAAKAGEGDVVRELLQKGAAGDPEQVECALRVAKSASVVWALAEAAPKAVRSDPGKWGLLYAAEAGHEETVIALLEAGVDIKAHDSAGITPLHIAAWNGHCEVVRELIIHGADVQSKDDNGDTPLHRAAAGDQLVCVRILLEAGAKKNVVNKKGKTPKDVAVSEIGQNVIDGKGLLNNYTLGNTAKSFSFGSVNTSGPLYSNNHNQSNASTSGVLFGMTCQSNAQGGGSGFGNASVFNNENIGSFPFGVGQGNAQHSNVFGMPAQSIGNETRTTSSFGNGQVNASQVSSLGAFGMLAEPHSTCFGMSTQSSSPEKHTSNVPQFGVLFRMSNKDSENKSSLLNSSQENIVSGGYTFGNVEQSTNKETKVFGIPDESANKFKRTFGSDPINSSTFGSINFPSNNSHEKNIDIFKKPDQSEKNVSNKSASVKTLSGYKIHRKSSESESDQMNCKLDNDEQNKIF